MGIWSEFAEEGLMSMEDTKSQKPNKKSSKKSIRKYSKEMIRQQTDPRHNQWGVGIELRRLQNSKGYWN